MSDAWPPQLKEWVAKCLGQMTDINRTEAQAELRQVIADAFAAHTLWTTDWAGVQLRALLPKPPPQFNTTPNLKRKKSVIGFHHKPPENSPATKKVKKALKSSTSSPALDPNDRAALEQRAQRFQREHEIEREKSRVGGQAALKANHHTSHLFSGFNSRSASPSEDPDADPNVMDWDRYTIVGTSQEIFKDYLRLTTDPKPEQIRPYPILQQTLLELKKRFRERTPYNWICSQFKSLRQDLTVQRIKNEFTVQVYEIHGRIALECGDMVEYNQCQATLKTLYDLGLPGRVEEFTAYRILMLLHGRNRTELNILVGQLTPKQKADPAVQHALSVQRALAMGNYHALFGLYSSAPNMGAYIMDHFVARERARALVVITRAYKTIPLSFIHQELAFESLQQTHEFLTEHSAAYFTNATRPDAQKELDCKPALPQLTQVFETKYRKVLIKGAI
ncbi:SAC3/GANP/Nin1/mts3/eIF-3 p25 family-domain-containing protein [Roridomyces roridus]|uniref:SAC3/GANP/Nin1/mts3/eIF-3 p25 family-domain-containing protein n=1 Tax=Roridomyces roridus TaxID=1738132 RepID=A0AAD7BK02_9AGAR|nr:SAC3/GANP/Nin1/mts3/eIF-3 p25 family-domain-containing protein [Roridomyces roridus]